TDVRLPLAALGESVGKVRDGEGGEHRPLHLRRVVEIASDDDALVRLPRGVGEDVVELPLAQPVVAAALDGQIVGEHAGRSRSERDARAAARLERIQTPSEARLLAEDDDPRILDGVPAQNRLAGDRRDAVSAFANLLEFTGGDPVHAEPTGEIVRDIAAAAASAETIDFLEQEDVAVDCRQLGGDPIEVDAALDVPGHDLQR